MTKQNIILTIIALGVFSTLGLEAAHGQVSVPYTLKAINPTQATLTWITDPSATEINVSRLPSGNIDLVRAVNPGVSNTVTLNYQTGEAFQVQEYQLVGNQLQLIRFWNTQSLPDFGTLTPTLSPTVNTTPSTTPVLSVTPTMTVTPTVERVKLQPRDWLPVVLR